MIFQKMKQFLTHIYEIYKCKANAKPLIFTCNEFRIKTKNISIKAKKKKKILFIIFFIISIQCRILIIGNYIN